MVKLSEKKEQEGREKAAKGEPAPESLVTWIFQDDFIPRARITKDGICSIMADYLGTPAEAYDDSGTLVWKRQIWTYNGGYRREEFYSVPLPGTVRG